MAETLGVTEMLPTKPCVYMLKCLPTQKFYIGSAKNLAKRIAAHKAKLQARKHPNQFLQNAWFKHGPLNFTIHVLQECETRNLLSVEQIYLDRYYDTQVKCMNLCPTAGSRLGATHTTETKTKIALWHSGKHVSSNTRCKLSANMKNRTELHFKAGSSNPMFGKCKEQHPFFGRRHSESSLKKMVDAKKGKAGKLGKAVRQKTLSGEFICTYDSTAIAERTTGIQGIRAAAAGRRNSAGGFRWEYIFMSSNMQDLGENNG